MAIKQPNELDFTDKPFVVILSGQPGLGKTTLALSAPDPLLFDFDRGIVRVRAEHRKQTSETDTYEELLKDMQTDAYRAAKSIILDTGGSLIQLMQPWAKQQEPKAARDGRAMFGVIKREFDRLTAQIRSDRKNCIIVFHTTEVQKGDVTTVRLSCEGSAKDIVWTPADLGGYLYMMGKKRMIGFSPCEEYFAKSCFGVTGVRELPELKPGQPNDFLTRLFDEARASIQAEMGVYVKEREAYDAAMTEGRSAIALCDTPEDLTAAMLQIAKLPHALTSSAELKALLAQKASELNVHYDKEAKAYVQDAA